VLFLGSAAFLAEAVGDWLGYTRVKDKIELRKELHLVDVTAVAPYRVVRKTIHTPETENSLGTNKYLSWTLENTSAAPGDPLRFAQLDVTYYTGGGDLAPHTPDVCTAAAGYAPVARTANPGLAGSEPGPVTHPCLYVRKDQRFQRRAITVHLLLQWWFVNTSYGVRA
jgi:hypothetical protein